MLKFVSCSPFRFSKENRNVKSHKSRRKGTEVHGWFRILILCLLVLAWTTKPIHAQQFSSMRNVFGGQNFSDGRWSTPNVFRGVTIYSPSGGSPLVGIPNVFGGMNYGDGTITTSNVFGGQNIYTPRGGFMSTTPNVFGGSNFSAGGYTTPNVFGGFHYYP